MTTHPATRLALLLGLSLLCVSPALAWERHVSPEDPILDGDVVDPVTGWPAVIVPGVPWIRPGPDGALGTTDDVVEASEVGDVDLVIRTVPDADGEPPTGVCEPFGRGVPIAFEASAAGPRGVTLDPPAYFEGLPLLGLAFADLDGDGYIGVTHLDGDTGDAAIETAELWPIGRRYAIAEGGVARGTIVVTRGGPPGAELELAIAGVAYAGPLSPDHFAARIPQGPAVMTRLPFLPETDPAKIIPIELEFTPADPAGRVAPRTEIAFGPAPDDPRIGEAFTLRLDGSDPTVGLARSRSGTAVRFGIAVEPDRDHYLPLRSRPLRPGLDDEGRVVAYEVPSFVRVLDDGDATQTRVRIVALDRLGNITAPRQPTVVRVKTGRSVDIVSPDTDGKERYESVMIHDARGVELLLDDRKRGEYDDENIDRLVLRAPGQVERIDLVLPDPDVDESGHVQKADGWAVRQCFDTQVGDEAFVPQLDLDGNGRIDDGDLAIIEREDQRKVKHDKKTKVRKRDGACFAGKKLKRPLDPEWDEDEDDD